MQRNCDVRQGWWAFTEPFFSLTESPYNHNLLTIFFSTKITIYMVQNKRKLFYEKKTLICEQLFHGLVKEDTLPLKFRSPSSKSSRSFICISSFLLFRIVSNLVQTHLSPLQCNALIAVASVVKSSRKMWVSLFSLMPKKFIGVHLQQQHYCRSLHRLPLQVGDIPRSIAC